MSNNISLDGVLVSLADSRGLEIFTDGGCEAEAGVGSVGIAIFSVPKVGGSRCLILLVSA